VHHTQHSIPSPPLDALTPVIIPPLALCPLQECASFPCQNGGTCQDALNSFTCTCKQGYGGLLCDSLPLPCFNIDCLNGGTCLNNFEQRSWECLCVTPYFGTLCHLRRSDVTVLDGFRPANGTVLNAPVTVVTFTANNRVTPWTSPAGYLTVLDACPSPARPSGQYPIRLPIR
jgi:hypothetical protein